VLTQSCRLALTRLPLGKSCEFSVQCSGWVGFGCLFNFFKMNRVDPKLSTRLPRAKSCEFSVQGSGWLGFLFFKRDRARPKLMTRLDSLASWQIVRVQCSGFRVGWILIFHDGSELGQRSRLILTRLTFANRASSVFRVQGELGLGG
jgi:hypothetical protein